MPVYLAIDYGTKRLGLAIARAGLAEPLVILDHSPALFDQLRQIIATEQPDQIIVGISERRMAELTQEFARELAAHTPVPIIFADETLSSKTVREKLKDSKKKTRTGHIDHFAAAYFLQEWLETQS